MPQASRSLVIDVRPEQMLSVILDFDRYPDFLPEVKSIAVSNRTATGADVAYEVELLKRLRYTLHMTMDGLSVRWKFVKGDLFKKNEGSWLLRAEPDGRTHATYTLEVAIGGLIPIPSAVTDKLAEGSLPGMLAQFKKRAETLFPHR